MTQADYLTLVLNEVDNSSSKYTQVGIQAVKDTYQEMLKHVGRFLVGTTTYSEVATAGNQEYTPTDFYEVIKVLWHDADETNFSVLQPISEEEAIEKYYNSENGTPSMYYQNGNNLVVVVTPDNAGTLEAVIVPVQSELTGAVVSVIPDRYTNVLVPGAIARVKMFDNDSTAVEYQAKYVAGLQDMKKELGSRFEMPKPSFMGR